jgi:RNA polymerase sigma factor (sigma-70 family)
VSSGWETLSDEQIERLRAGIERAVARQCPYWLAIHREDIAQNTLVRVVEAWNRAERSGEPPHSYLVKAVFTAVAGEIRTLRRERSVALDAMAEDAVPASDAPGPEGRAAAGQLGRAIRACLATLIDSRRVVTALALMGFGRERIAALLEVEVKKVDNDRHRGLRDLRRCLEEKGFRP